eukprot:CAMPEP_0206236104 /NCGR_PEP_ID=MMETSP0047_2-20121206/13524_1 /ASSEMBLY_ACC=CAM_ASM_000192 /TAXON_ID=195065 /ORGANISM="Chroomonas mesostigmatica_cf, Strain CCMP1168" /LENGTH=110 /DNA_ID=CAMNT_0053660391 /DNA_START=23 /DNA_END=355 /DNA_ORIENTATION=+
MNNREGGAASRRRTGAAGWARAVPAGPAAESAPQRSIPKPSLERNIDISFGISVLVGPTAAEHPKTTSRTKYRYFVRDFGSGRPHRRTCAAAEHLPKLRLSGAFLLTLTV